MHALLLRRNQVLVRDSYAYALAKQRVDPAHRVILDVPLVQSEGEFIHVALEMLFSERVVYTVEAAFENSPYTLDAIRMRHSVHIFLGAVVHRGVAVNQIHAHVGAVFVGV